jgi:hypothetical protein
MRPADRALTSRLSREIFLAEVLLWKTPWERALWIRGIAFDRAFWAPSRSFLLIAILTVLTEDFTVLLM